MNLFNNRPFLVVIAGIGTTGVLCLLGVTALCFVDHRGFPWALWLGGFQWFWCTWWAGKRLFMRKTAEGFPARGDRIGQP